MFYPKLRSMGMNPSEEFGGQLAETFFIRAAAADAMTEQDLALNFFKASRNDREGGSDASTSTVEASSWATKSIEGTDCSSQSGDRGAGHRIEGSGARTVGCGDL
jgi:hypothetical protein